MKIKNKTRLKSVICIVLSFIVIFALIPSQSNVYAARLVETTDKATGLIYDTAGVILGYEGKATDVVIPAKLGKVTIKKIAPSAFFNHNKIKSVTFPKGLTEIGNSAFARCPSLTSVKFPNTLKIIDAYAFESCTSLKDVTIPNGVKTIGEGAFLFCPSITKMNIPDSVTTLGVGAFQGISITSIEIPSSITSISGALFGETLLKSVVIPKTIKTIEMEAFSGCSKLTSVTIPKTVTKIEYGAFENCPLVTIYGENGSAAQLYCANYNINFVDMAVSSKPTKTVIKKDTIVVPATTTNETVTAKPSKTKISIKNVAKSLEAYTIKGEDYYKITDLASILRGTEKEFSPGYDKFHGFMQLLGGSKHSTKIVVSKDANKDKKAIRVYPIIYYGENDISGAISIYSINGEDYYNFADTMNMINCGVVKNTKTGVLNLDPKLGYEPLNSPVFAPVPKGNAEYRKVQKSLYDAYLSGKEVLHNTSVTVPDNTVLYVPRGITYENGRKIYLGNNSRFIVRGEWRAEYPTKVLQPTSKTTKNAVYTYSFNPREPIGMYGANNNVVYVSSNNNFEWGNMPLTSANISYGNVTNGVQPIILNVIRDKRDPATSLFVYFHVKGGESYGYLYNNVNESIDLTPQLATVVAKNIGKKATIDRINVQNANGVSFSSDLSIPVNWTITTSGPAPSELKTVKYSNFDRDDTSLVFDGLSHNSYIAKYLTGKEFGYHLISPKNDYSIAPIQKNGSNTFDILGDNANIALFTGKKEASGKNAYSFFVSPFSNNINYAVDISAYPSQADLVFDNNKVYLNFMLNKLKNTAMSYGSSTFLMVKYHKKGDPADTLGLLYAERTGIDKSGSGKLDLTPSLTELNNSKGAINIDHIYVYTYMSRIGDQAKIPSAKFAVVPCNFTTSATDSVKLGEDTVALIQADGLQAATGSTPITDLLK